MKCVTVIVCIYIINSVILAEESLEKQLGNEVILEDLYKGETSFIHTENTRDRQQVKVKFSQPREGDPFGGQYQNVFERKQFNLVEEEAFDQFSLKGSAIRSHIGQGQLIRSQKVKGASRSIREACPGGEGNYGFNSFNFMTFTLLVYNLVANVNNNINNNNNNANKNNINAINQDSNSVSTNTNAVNQIMVTILPIPGKRSIYGFLNGTRIDGECLEKYIEALGSFFLDHGKKILQQRSSACAWYQSCLSMKSLMKFSNIREAFNPQLFTEGLSPFMSKLNCGEIFPNCSFSKKE